jgi:hypothetical protein
MPATTPAATVTAPGRRLPAVAPPARHPPLPSSPPFLTRRASPPVTGPPPIRLRPAGGATAPPRIYRRPNRHRRRFAVSPHLPLLGPPDMEGLRTRNLTLRSAASTTTPASGDFAAGRSLHYAPARPHLATPNPNL